MCIFDNFRVVLRRYSLQYVWLSKKEFIQNYKKFNSVISGSDNH